MRVHYGCPLCGRIVLLRGPLDESESLLERHPRWSKGHPCITEGCVGAFEKMTRDDLIAAPPWVTVEELTVQELFGALCGFGIPSEIASDPEVVKALLLSEPIVAVSVRRASTRTLVEHIDLANGLRLHFTLSSEGAVIYKITRAKNERRNVDDDHREVPSAAEGDSVQRDDRLHGSLLRRKDISGNTPLWGIATLRRDGEHHHEDPRDPAAVSAGRCNDGSAQQAGEADPASTGPEGSH